MGSRGAPPCPALLFAPHTTEGFSRQVATLLNGVALALQCNRTLVLTPQFSMTYRYVAWSRLGAALRERVRREGVSHFLDMAHLSTLLESTLRTVSFHSARPCLKRLLACHTSNTAHNRSLAGGLDWERVVAGALLSGGFSEACELSEGGLPTKRRDCFSQISARTLRWHTGAAATAAVQGCGRRVGLGAPHPAPLCVTAHDGHIFKYVLPAAGRKLVERLAAAYRHAPRYEQAARRVLGMLKSSAGEGAAGMTSTTHTHALIAIHWREDALFKRLNAGLSNWSLPRVADTAQRYFAEGWGACAGTRTGIPVPVPGPVRRWTRQPSVGPRGVRWRGVRRRRHTPARPLRCISMLCVTKRR